MLCYQQKYLRYTDKTNPHNGKTTFTLKIVPDPLLFRDNIDGLVQKRRNSIINALELRLSSTNPSI